MARSDTSSLILRNTSFVILHRLTPQMACSTFTRNADSNRLLLFSTEVSSRLRGFFWLVRFAHRRLVALKAGVFVQLGISRVADCFVIGDLLMVDPKIGFIRRWSLWQTRLINQNDVFWQCLVSQSTADAQATDMRPQLNNQLAGNAVRLCESDLVAQHVLGRPDVIGQARSHHRCPRMGRRQP
jgi:hypothetical protein